MEIRKTTSNDVETILNIHRQAFGGEEEAELVQNLMSDPTSDPSCSLLAECDGVACGHVLFTQVQVAREMVAADILCPLAVVPKFQKQGVGKALIQKGFEMLSEGHSRLVFVYGDPNYYSHFGFEAALPYGLEAPYDLPEDYKPGWMVHALVGDCLDTVSGKIICAESLMQPKYWVV